MTPRACPFCGVDPVRTRDWLHRPFYQCPSCGGSALAAVWNLRAQRPAPVAGPGDKQRAKLDAIREERL